MKKVIVIGSGISGLTTCYHLSKHFHVELYEMKPNFGGLAKSKRHKDERITEHSWRGFNKHYHNLFNIMKQIPDDNKTVYDNLNFTKNIQGNSYNFNFSLIFVIYYILKYICTGKLRQENELYKIKAVNKLKYVDKTNYNYILGDLSHIGADPDLLSVKTIINSILYLKNNNFFYLGKPTQEALIQPWINYLQKQKVKIFNNYKLTNIYYNNKSSTQNQTIQKIIMNNNTEVIGDYYVFALPPYALHKLFQNKVISKSIQNQLLKLHQTGYHKELSFRLYFKDNILLNTNINLPESDWGIVCIPAHEYLFKGVNLGKGVKSYISGTCISGGSKSSHTNKSIFNTHLKDVKQEIKRQLETNTKLNDVIKKYNKNKVLSDYKYDIEIWEEWYDTKEGCDTNDIFWCNTVDTFPHLLNQDIGITNGFFCGVHTKTSIGVATMECASESGTLASNIILKKEKKPVAYHYDHTVKNVITDLDDLLYKYKLPYLFDMILLFVLIIIVYKISL